MSNIWDAHSHWMPAEVAQHTTFFKQGWSDVEGLLKTLDSAGIEKAVLLYPTSDAHLNMGSWSALCGIYNEQIARKIKQHPDRLIGTGILPVDKSADLAGEVEKIRDLGLSGFSLGSSYDGKYLDDESFLPVFEKAEQENLPVFIHSQIINPIGFERFPRLKFVFAHFAGVLPFLGDRFDSTYTMLRSRNIVKDLGNLPSEILKNIYVDTSGVKSPSMLNMALEFFGPERILWGSDFPAKRDLDKSLAVVDGLQGKEKILGGNLIEILKKAG
jgi:predicted TIM-barrel fold metal-dependent hydrolase